MALPITRVVLYKHGVGYFEREGDVTDDTTLTLSFKQSEVSDVLKSLTVLDLNGGFVTAVSYDSTKPLEQLLSEIALSIPDNGSLFGLIPQLKGAKVHVVLNDEDQLEGVLVGVDSVERALGDQRVMEVRATLLTDAGTMRTFPLYDSQVQLLDDGLKRDLDFYLRTQLSAKKKDARTFTLFAEGIGTRTVRVSYVLEAPVWKATYRILLNDDEEPVIQGWAVVDNTQDEDWSDVQLALVAGLPVSFTHDLYTPRFLKRPNVAVQETTGVLPPVVESGMVLDDSISEGRIEVSDHFVGARGLFPKGVKIATPGMMSMDAAPMLAAAAPQRSMASSMQTQVRERQVGDLFEYNIANPVNIRRNQSALVPIVLKPFNGRAVLLYQKQARAENPMRAVEFENTTGLTLEGGPVTVLDNGSYVGEAMLETMKPKEKRLVPYAVELSVRVMDSIGSHEERVSRTIIKQKTLWTHYATVAQTTYTLSNKADREYTLFIDHPRQGKEWELLEHTPTEITDNYWRFQVALSANATIQFVVKARLPQSQNYALINTDERQLNLWLSQKYIDATTAKALAAVLQLKQQASEQQARENALQAERTKIHEEQKRIRENLNSLGDRASEKDLRERYVRTLNTQEDRLVQLDAEQQQARRTREGLEAELQMALGKIKYEGAL